MFVYTEKKLARDICKAAAATGRIQDAKYQADSSTVTVVRRGEEDQAPTVLYLGNLMLKLGKLSRKERNAVIHRFVHDTLSTKDPSEDELLFSLALRVRTAYDIFRRRKTRKLHGLDVPTPVTFGCGDPVLELIADKGISVFTVSQEQLVRAEIDADDAYRVAAAALVRSTIASQWIKLQEHIWRSTYGDDYDFARLVAAGSEANLPFNAAPRVFAPSHSVCLVTNSDDAEVLGTMVELGYEKSKNHRSFAHLLWTQSESGHWTEWNPDADSSVLRVVESQRVQERLSQYNQQQTYLEQLLESRGEDNFVASYLVSKEEKGHTSICTYTLNLPSYLPKTDLVAIVDPNAKGTDSVLGYVPWNDFSATLGEDTLSELVDEYPTCFRVADSLSEKQNVLIRQILKGT